jgi:iron complex transport system ATP-binding protein
MSDRDKPEPALLDQMLIEARGLSVDLGGRRVLKAVDVTLRQGGGVCALIGPNGAGKSTLLRALAGIVPVSAGAIRYGGPAADDPAALSYVVAYVPQDRTVHWDLSVAAVVALGQAPHDLAQARRRIPDMRALRRETIDDALRRMDIVHLAHRSIREISGGERARVLIARALAQDTNVLLADEPVAGLDPAHQLSLFAHLRTLAREGRAIVVALHDLSLAVRFADRVILLHEGRIAGDGPPIETLSRERIAKVFGIESRIATIDGIPVLVPIGPTQP